MSDRTKTNIIYDYLVTCIEDKEIKALIEKLQDYLLNGSFIDTEVQKCEVLEFIKDLKENYINKESE